MSKENTLHITFGSSDNFLRNVITQWEFESDYVTKEGIFFIKDSLSISWQISPDTLFDFVSFQRVNIHFIFGKIQYNSKQYDSHLTETRFEFLSLRTVLIIFIAFYLFPSGEK
jgi:hypothetical protein